MEARRKTVSNAAPEADSAAIPLAGYDVLLVVTPRRAAPQQADLSVHLEGDTALVVQRAGVHVLTMPLAGLVARVEAYADSAGTGGAIPSAILLWEQVRDSVRAPSMPPGSADRGGTAASG